MRPEALREILEGTAAETGEAFFARLVKHLARALGTKGAWVTEWLEDEQRLRALSFWLGDAYFGPYEYDIAGTPCEPVIHSRGLIHVPERVVELFPGDPDLPPLGAVSYMGVPLLDTDGRILGHLAVLHDAPLPEDESVTAIFNIFAGRAAAELRRLRRDRDLREREQKLSLLIASAMDAIVELDDELRVATLNPAAQRTFGCDPEKTRGTPLDRLLTPGARDKLARIAQKLERETPGRQSAWVPDGLASRRDDGTEFSAEATLSRFELAGRSCYTLILRSIDERLEAERRIRDLLDETAYLRAQIDELHGFDEIVGTSPALCRVLADVERVAQGDTTVLITGETGTGKELIARAIHRRSPRSRKPLVTVNCAAIAANLQESELFGHERGAFTGATQRREGRFRLADGGSIFLDEVGEMPLDLQAKLLRVLQQGQFEPVGGSRTLRVDVRIIAATNRDLDSMAERGEFRKDLLYRLNVFPLHVPPLRERGDDVVLLAESFARSFAQRRGLDLAPLPSGGKARLLGYDWPGNVRELQNVIERALITSTDGRTLNFERALPDTPVELHRASEPRQHPDDSPEERILTAAELQELERTNLLRALQATDWKISGRGGAAEQVGVHPNTLQSRMKKLGIRRPERS